MRDDEEEANKTLESVGIKSLDAVNFCVLAPGGYEQRLKSICRSERLLDQQSCPFKISTGPFAIIPTRELERDKILHAR